MIYSLKLAFKLIGYGIVACMAFELYIMKQNKQDALEYRMRRAVMELAKKLDLQTGVQRSEHYYISEYYFNGPVGG